MDGGMIIPMQAEDAISPAANLPGVLLPFMAGIRMLPSAEVSAEDDPLNPPKNHAGHHRHRGPTLQEGTPGRWKSSRSAG